jgi:hypothetical protein
MNRKPIIFFCDDKKKWTDIFTQRHEKEFEIETTNSSRNFKLILKDLIGKGKNPDVILIDLYHPRTEDETIIMAGEAAVEQLKVAIEDAKKPIHRAWNPDGFKMLKEARELCPDTPIAIYTEQGLTLAGDTELKKVSDENGEWMLKGQGDFYEAYKLRSMLASKHYASITQKALFVFSAIVFIVALAYSYLVEQTVMSVLSFGATITSLALAIMPYIITYLDRHKRKGT